MCKSRDKDVDYRAGGKLGFLVCSFPLFQVEFHHSMRLFQIKISTQAVLHTLLLFHMLIGTQVDRISMIIAIRHMRRQLGFSQLLQVTFPLFSPTQLCHFLNKNSTLFHKNAFSCVFESQPSLETMKTLLLGEEKSNTSHSKGKLGVKYNMAVHA